jgi:HAD superfamily hydrolase (TIGR01450 family)
VTLDAIVCDLDGVLYRGNTAIAGAGEALRALRDGGIDIHFVTNNSTKTASEAAVKIAHLTGFEAAGSDVVTSAEAAAQLLADEKPRTFLFGAAGAREPLEAAGVPIVDDWSEAGAVIAGLDPRLSYERLTAAVLAIRAGARFIATNIDATYPTSQGLWPGAGALVAAIVAASGVQPEVAGKPEPAIRRLLEKRTEGRRVAVIGDRPETDLALGAAEGWATVLVLSGVTASAEGVDPVPDHVVDTIADVPNLFGL